VSHEIVLIYIAVMWWWQRWGTVWWRE